MVKLKNDEILGCFKKILKKIPDGAKYYTSDLHIHSHYSSTCSENQYETEYPEIIKKAKEKNLINEAVLNNLEVNMNKEDIKDLLLKGLIINRAYETGLRLIAITDHDTLRWFQNEEEIEDIIKSVKNKKEYHYDLVVLPGIEITAYTNIHVIAIVQPFNLKKLKLFVHYLDYMRETGNKLTVNQVINHVTKNLSGIIYIPHLDYNKLSPDERKAIITNVKVSAISTTKEYQDHINSLLKTEKEYKRDTKYPFSFIQSSDAHSLKNIGNKPMYFKMTKPSFEGLSMALRNPENRVSMQEPQDPSHPSIVGIALKGNKVGKNEKRWCYVKFSKEMNCLIGARGTGKSTIIKWITSIIKGKTLDKKDRDWFASDFEHVILFIKIEGKYYVVYVEPIFAESDYVKELGPTEIDNWIKVYQIKIEKNHNMSLKKIERRILSKIETRSYYQTEIEDLADDKEKLYKLFGEFLMQYDAGNTYKKIIDKKISIEDKLKKYVNYLNTEKLKKYCDKYIGCLEKLKNEEEKFIEKLNNEALDNKIKIELNKDNCKSIEQLDNIIEKHLKVYNHNYKREIIDHLKSSFFSVVKQYGIYYIFYLFEYSEEKIIHECLISPYVSTNIEDSQCSLKENKILDIIKEIVRNESKSGLFKESLIDIEKYNLDVIYNVKHGKPDPEFKAIEKLSLGQKCVAILSFVLNSSDYVGDKKPFIIDQPEDHLDNRYIYEYLSKDLKHTKSKRQVILSTHNPNLPICSDAEQIIVLTSNGKRFWPATCGSLDYKENKQDMAKEVLEILEGGINAFETRARMYGYLF